MGQCSSRRGDIEIKKQIRKPTGYPVQSVKSTPASKEAKEAVTQIMAVILNMKSSKVLGSVPPIEIIRTGISVVCNMKALSPVQQRKILIEAIVKISKDSVDQDEIDDSLLDTSKLFFVSLPS